VDKNLNVFFCGHILPEYARFSWILSDLVRFNQNVKECSIIMPGYYTFGHNLLDAITVTSAQIMRDYERISNLMPMLWVIQFTLIYMNQVGVLYLYNE